MKIIAMGLCVTSLAAGLAAQRGSQPDTSVKALTTAAVAYVADYQQQFAFLVADEAYVQHTFDTRGGQTGQRIIHGELFLTFVAADRAWIAVHDVADVDGRPVEDRDDLRLLLQRGSLTSVGRTLADRNARFNIGHVTRNFNEPTLALLVFNAARVANFKFSVAHIEYDGETTLVTLTFAERDRPTIISGMRGEPVFSSGAITIEANTGRVQRTQIEWKDGSLSAGFTTDYVPEAKLGLWVPAVFREHYEARREDPRESIECEATYTNYRRFDVSVRIK